MATDTSNATGPVEWAFDNDDLIRLAEALKGADEIVLDLETTGLDEYAWEGGPLNGGVGARIVLASMTLPQRGAFGYWDGEVPVTWVLPLSHPESPFQNTWRSVLRGLLAAPVAAGTPFANQNMPFDARWLMACAATDVSSLISWDTKDGARLMNENVSSKLKVAVPEIFGIPPWNDFALNYPGAAERVPLLDLGAYAARDTWWTWMWMRWQRNQLWLEDMSGGPVEEYPPTAEDRMDANIGRLAVYVSMPTVRSLTKVMQRGMLLDVPEVRRTLAGDEETTRAAFIGLREFSRKLGMGSEWGDRPVSTAANSLWFKELTRRAVDVGELEVYSTTANLNPQWNKYTLPKNVRNGSKLAELILQERNATKRAQYMRSWLSLADRDGVIHANYNTGLVTGRLSSDTPNLQQVSKKLRPLFIPRPGYVMADFDFSQLELRVAAFLWQIEPMLEAYRNGQDLHRLMAASTVNRKLKQDGFQAFSRESGWQRPFIGPSGTIDTRDLGYVAAHDQAYVQFLESFTPLLPENVSPEDRQKAKAQNFGLLYLQSPVGFRDYAENQYGVALTLEEAVEAYEAFFETWTGMREAHARILDQVRRDGYVVSPLGRMRRLPDIWGADPGHAERQAVNSPVQGFGSDLMQIALASIQGTLPSSVGLKPIPEVRPVATVHDSIVCELPIGNWQELAEQVKDRMEHLEPVLERFGVELNLPLVADYSVGTRWSWSDVSDPQPTAALALDLGEGSESPEWTPVS